MQLAFTVVRPSSAAVVGVRCDGIRNILVFISEDKGLVYGDIHGGQVLAPIGESPPAATNFSNRLKKEARLNGVRLFVGLPLDAVSPDCNSVNHARAIAAGLKALKLLGVEGVELPIWWGIVEKESMGKYEWSGYLAIAEMVQSAGLKLHVTLCFNGSKTPSIPLPRWVSQIGDSEAGIFFTDRSGQQYKECLPFAVDELPVLNGKSAIQGISMGLGPDGELRYPSHHKLPNINGVGEFRCYDQNMLRILKEHAEASGNSMWGLGGPHDAPNYGQSPNSAHGDRLLSIAAATFDSGVSVYGKIPLMHSWYRTRSHPSELTAGFYNTANRDGYESVAKMFAKNSSCRKHGVNVSGQNSSSAGAPGDFDQIKKNLSGDYVLDLFTYNRMGAYFFSPEHFPSFTKFVQSLDQLELHADDLPLEDEEAAEFLVKSSESSKQLQTTLK
ncbi:hypothetical protein K1719_005722 [Acacia pycnantha]|nr:hypothetical protein K1719_005722 [Acacia pycnantha]